MQISGIEEFVFEVLCLLYTVGHLFLGIFATPENLVPRPAYLLQHSPQCCVHVTVQTDDPLRIKSQRDVFLAH